MKEFLDYNPEQPGVVQSEHQDLTDKQFPALQVTEPAEIGIIRELNPKKILDEIKMELSGHSWDPIKKKYEKITGMKALMSDAGISKILQIMSSFINQLTTFSNFDQERVDKLVVLIVEETYFNVAINWRDFGIPDKSSIATVQLKILMAAISALNRAKGAGDRNVVRGAVQESISNRQMPDFYPQPQQSLLGKLNPFGGRKQI